jgi:hypothetical protein
VTVSKRRWIGTGTNRISVQNFGLTGEELQQCTSETHSHRAPYHDHFCYAERQEEWETDQENSHTLLFYRRLQACCCFALKGNEDTTTTTNQPTNQPTNTSRNRILRNVIRSSQFIKLACRQARNGISEEKTFSSKYKTSHVNHLIMRNIEFQHNPVNSWCKVKAAHFLDVRHYGGGKAPAVFTPRSFLVLIFGGWVDPRAHGSIGSFGRNPQWHHRGSIPRPSDYYRSALTTTLPQAPNGWCNTHSVSMFANHEPTNVLHLSLRPNFNSAWLTVYNLHNTKWPHLLTAG